MSDDKSRGWNTPAETGVAAGEEFEKMKIGDYGSEHPNAAGTHHWTRAYE